MSKRPARFLRLRGCKRCHSKKLVFEFTGGYSGFGMTSLVCCNCHEYVLLCLNTEKLNRKTRKRRHHHEHMLTAEWNRENVGGGWLSAKQVKAMLVLSHSGMREMRALTAIAYLKQEEKRYKNRVG